jgi:low molecular weight protein-tyrosine phosphatase
MGTRSKTVLFLCTGNYYRSRYAEALFNAAAARRGLPWRAESRGLALERGVTNFGPLSADVFDRLHERGLLGEDRLRHPLPLSSHDLRRAALVIALKEAEHRPLLRERFPGWAHRVEFWHVHDLDCCGVEEALEAIDREVEALIERLAGEQPAGDEVKRRRPAAGGN